MPNKTITIKRKTEKPITTKYGEKTSVGLLIDGKDGEMWINGFKSPMTDTWVEGDTVEVEVYQSKDGRFWNFKAPDLNLLIFRGIKEILEILKGSHAIPKEEVEQEEQPEGDLPF